MQYIDKPFFIFLAPYTTYSNISTCIKKKKTHQSQLWGNQPAGFEYWSRWPPTRSTSPFRKPIDGVTMLNTDSFHPKSLVSNMQHIMVTFRDQGCAQTILAEGLWPQVLNQIIPGARSHDRTSLFIRDCHQEPTLWIFFIKQHSTVALDIKHVINEVGNYDEQSSSYYFLLCLILHSSWIEERWHHRMAWCVVT